MSRFPTGIFLLVFGWSASAWALVIHVPAEYPTIQQGLNALEDRDTVLLADGLYPEALTAPSLSFWLIGDVPLDTGDFSRPVIDISLTPDSINQRGFVLPMGSFGHLERLRFRNQNDVSQRDSTTGGVTIFGDSATFAYCSFDSCFFAITSSHWSHAVDLALDHCVFRFFWSIVGFSLGHIRAGDCAFENIPYETALRCPSESVIERCQFRNNTLYSLVTSIAADTSMVTVQDCIFGPDTTINHWGYVYLDKYGGTFRNNTFVHLRTENNVLEVRAGGGLEPLISGNTFYDCRAAYGGNAGPALLIGQPIPNMEHPYRVEDNVMAACTLGFWARGIFAARSGMITGNRIYGSGGGTDPAIRVDTVDHLVLTQNLIFHNGYGLGAPYGLPVQATFNWWGDSTGPYHATQNPNGLGDRITGHVDFTPWYPDTSFLAVPDIHKPLPEKFVLESYPNPFNSTVTLKLIPPEVMIARVELYDVLGRKIREIWSGPLAFEHQVRFNATNLASGIYFVRVTNTIHNRPLATTKLMLLK